MTSDAESTTGGSEIISQQDSLAATKGARVGAPASRWTVTSLVAFLASLVAALVPITQIIQAYSQNALKAKELEHSITMEFLHLALSKDTSPPDRKQVLTVLTQLDTPLQKWATSRLNDLTSQSEKALTQGRQLEESLSTMTTRTADYVAAVNRQSLLKQQIETASQSGDLNRVDDLRTEFIRVSVEVVNTREALESSNADVKNLRAGVAKATVGTEEGLSQPRRAPPKESATVASKATPTATTVRSDEGSPQPRRAPLKESATLASEIKASAVAPLFPIAPVANIEKNLPPLLDALQQFGLADRTMVLVALSTIRAETPWFVPISERATLFNTSRGGQPFDLYDRRMDLGNQGPPDGAMFKGRGFMLLTGRANYERVDRALGLGNSLVTRPELENDPKIAAQTLAFFLKNVETPIREAVASGDLATVRRLVNGGSHGLADFTDTFTRGQVLLPEHD